MEYSLKKNDVNILTKFPLFLNEMSSIDDDNESNIYENILNSVIQFDESFSPFRSTLKYDNKETLYMKWRKALLYNKMKNKEFNCNDVKDRRINYLFARELLLSIKFPLRNKSKQYGRYENDSTMTGTTTRSEYDPSEYDENKTISASKWYSFKGMHHIMAHHTNAVTRLKFGHDHRGLLCMASKDGNLSIIDAFAENIDSSLKILKGHTSDIMDFEFSKDNEFIVSCSLDRSIRVWDAATGECVRHFEEDNPLTCIRFHPINQHILVCGDIKGNITFISYSSGKTIGSCNLKYPITSFAMDDQALNLYAGDSFGNIHFIEIKLSGSEYTFHIKGHANLSKGTISSIEWRQKHTPKWEKPLLLISQCDSNIKLLSTLKSDTNLQAEIFSVFPKKMPRIPIRASFSPFSYIRSHSCVTFGSEDGTIYIYSYRQSSDPKKRGRVTPINQLAGHSGAVLDTQWNQEESLLASSDETGMVILWKRIEI